MGSYEIKAAALINFTRGTSENGGGSSNLPQNAFPLTWNDQGPPPPQTGHTYNSDTTIPGIMNGLINPASDWAHVFDNHGKILQIFTQWAEEFYFTLTVNARIGNSIYLDGSSIPISFPGLPAGFIMKTLYMRMRVRSHNPADFNEPTLWEARMWFGSVNSISGYTRSPNMFPLGTNSGPAGTGYYLQDVLWPSINNDTNIFPSILEVISENFGMFSRAFGKTGGPGNQPFFFPRYFTGPTLTGTYDILRLQWDINGTKVKPGEPLPDPDEEVQPDITITKLGSDGDSGALGFNGVTGVKAVRPSDDPDVPDDEVPVEIVQQDDFSLWFIIPMRLWMFNLRDTIYIIGVGNGQQFTGSIILAKLRILVVAKATGIYQIVPGKTTDTVYDRSGAEKVPPVFEAEVRIPNPSAKTGLIGG